MSFAPPVTLDVSFTPTPGRRSREVQGVGGVLQQLVFSEGEDISGDLKVGVQGGKRVDHAGIKMELKGIVGA